MSVVIFFGVKNAESQIFKISSSNPAVSDGIIIQGETKQIIYRAVVQVTGSGGANFTNLTFTPTGTFVASDINTTYNNFGYRVWASLTDNIATASSISNLFPPQTTGNPVSIIINNPYWTSGNTYYIWITADISPTAIAGHTLTVGALSLSDFTFNGGTKAGLLYGGGTQKIGWQSIFTSNGTFTVPEGVTSITVQAWGGGGAGGAGYLQGQTRRSGGGGGGGAYDIRSNIGVAPSQTYTVTIGSGGTTSTPNGGTSSATFGAVTITALGGSSGGAATSGGQGTNGSGGVGGTAGTFSGGNGANGAESYGGGGGSSAGTNSNGNNATGQTGGAAVTNGGAGGNGNSIDGGNGLPGSIPGGGGGGGRGYNSKGGSGGNGQIVISWTTDCTPPLIPTASNNGPICAGSTLNLTASAVSGATYAWAGPNGFTSTSQNPTIPNASTAASGTYSVVATVNGCTSAAGTTNVTINPNAAVSSVTGSSPLCIGSTANYTANGVVLGGGTGTWSSDNTSVATVDGAGNVTALSAGTCKIIYTITGGCGGTKAAQQQLLVGSSPGNPSVFGDNQWNVYAYNGTNSDLSANTYRGYYVEPNLSFDTRSKWLATNTPSSATGYQGCSVDKLMTFVYKRKGFPCGLYSISVGHDDEASLYVNGTLVTSLTGWTYSPVAVSGNYFLDENSTVELRIRNTGGGDSYGELVFNSTPSLTGTPAVNSPICPESGSINGTSESNAEIVVYSDAAQIGTTTSNSSGQWSLSVGSLSTGAIITATARANNKCLSNVSSSVSVSPANTVGAASSTPTLCINTALTPITHTTAGATGIGTPTGLPAGVSATWASNQITISGTPSQAGTFNYSVPLTGGCGSVNATGTITVIENPTVANAGPDQTGTSTCGLTIATLGGNTPSVGTGAWTIVSGSGGTITNPSSPTSTFSGTAGSTYTLRWTISNSPCTASTDDVVITFNQNPTVANAGPDQTGASTCGLTTVTLGGNTPTVGTGVWTIVSGSDGTISNPSSPTSTFSGTVGSTYTLRWTISNSPCAASTDDVVVTFNSVSAGGSISGGSTICSGLNSGLLILSGQTGSVVKWQSSVSPFSSWTDIANTNTTYTSEALTQTTRFRAVVTNGTCPVTYSTPTEVTIDDQIAPVITQYLLDGTVSCVNDVPAGKTSYQDFYDAGGRVTENCTALNNLKVTFVDVISHDGVCKVTRTYTIKDASGNPATCTQIFTIDDTKAPVINSVVDIQSAPNDNSCGANLYIAAPTSITENCSLVNEGANYQYTIGSIPHSGHGSFTALFPEGITAITWTVTDVCGHVSAQIIQTVQVGINLTSISYDNGSTETGNGSGIQPMQTSTHEYFVDNKMHDPDYTYSWVLYENNGGSPGAEVSSSLYAINPVNQADIKLTFKSDIPTRNYILSVIKTQSSTLCKKQENLIVKVLKNTFDTELKPFGNQCQAGETGTPSTILWEVTFSGGGVAPYSLNYAVNLTDESNNQIKACTGTVSNITLIGTTSSLSLSGCSDAQTMPYMRVEKTATDSYKVLMKYTMSSVTARNFKASIQIDATDQFSVSEIEPGNNSETLDLHGVPNTSPITTD